MFLLKKLTTFLLSSDDDERMQSIYSTEALAHGTSKDLECQKRKIKCSSIIKQYKNV